MGWWLSYWVNAFLVEIRGWGIFKPNELLNFKLQPGRGESHWRLQSAEQNLPDSRLFVLWIIHFMEKSELMNRNPRWLFKLHQLNPSLCLSKKRALYLFSFKKKKVTEYIYRPGLGFLSIWTCGVCLTRSHASQRSYWREREKDLIKYSSTSILLHQPPAWRVLLIFMGAWLCHFPGSDIHCQLSPIVQNVPVTSHPGRQGSERHWNLTHQFCTAGKEHSVFGDSARNSKGNGEFKISPLLTSDLF